MQFDHQGRHYHMIRASDLKRDGMSLELHSGSRAVAEVFYSEVTREFTISVFEQDLPLAVIEQLISSARVGLLPAERVHGL
jgi:hypothetical protein